MAEGRSAGAGICFSAPVSSDFYVVLCAVWWRAQSGSWTAATVSLLDEVYAFLRAARWRARSGSWSGCCHYPTGRGVSIPSHYQAECTELERPLLDEVYAFLRRKMACAELELDGCCWYPTGRDVRLPSRHQVACVELEQDGTERSGPTRTAFRRKGGRAGAAQEEHLLLLRNTAAAGLDCCWIYVRICMCLCTFGL